ncbi:MAG: tyrosine--tRNA ligase [Candidatus Pacearchaeota archaeon]
MEIEKRRKLVERNTQEILGEEKLEEALRKEKPVVYLGTAITGSPHLMYLPWAIKLADFLKAGFKVKVLLADLHGALDNTPWDLLEKRYNYYSKAIPLMFKALGVGVENLEIVRGSDIQLNNDYFFDLLRLSKEVSSRDAQKSSSEVVKQDESPKVSGMIYPLMQALDEEYLGVDVQCAGVDQRKIFVLASENLEKIGYEKRSHVMIPMLSGLTGSKMSASDENSKIDLLDDEKSVEKKVKNAAMEEGNPENGLMEFLKYVVFVLKSDRGESFVVERPEKFGGKVEYSSYEELEKDFADKKLHPLDLKQAVAKEINSLLEPFRENSEELKGLHEEAYGK